MTEHLKLPRFRAIVIGILVMLTMANPGTARAALRSVPTDPPTTEPETSEPPTTEPETSAPVTTEPASEAGEQAADDTIDTGAAILGIVGFFALVGIAAWWMVRLRNEDDEPHPRQLDPDDPLPGQDLL